MTKTYEQIDLFNTDNENIKINNKTQKPSRDNGFSDYIVYVDESGDHSLVSIDEQYPVFVLAFCIFHKRHYSEAIVPLIEKLKFNYFGHDQIILHENEIRKEKGIFNIFQNKNEKNLFMEKITQIMANTNFILVSCTIEKTRMKKVDPQANIYNKALSECLSSLHNFLKEKKQDKLITHIVFECRGKKEDRDLELEFRRLCDENENKIKVELPFKSIFSDKKALSTGLQFADLVARPIGLNSVKPDQNNRAFEILRHKFYCSGGRKNIGSGYEGYGMKILPSLKSEKPQ